MTVATGVPVTIMIFGEDGGGVLITCTRPHSGMGPLSSGESVFKAILGPSTLDVKNTDSLAVDKIEEMVRRAFGKSDVQILMLEIKNHARSFGYHLA